MILQPDSVDNIKKLESDPKLRQDKFQDDPPIVLVSFERLDDNRPRQAALSIAVSLFSPPPQAIHGGAGGTIPPK